MAKQLVFLFDGREIAFAMSKVDRAKLYGYKELEVLDEKGRVCELATLGSDGHTVVGRGGTGIGYLSQDGNWCEKSELTPVDLEGNEIEPVPSSFSAPITLDAAVSIDEYLAHNIRSIYVMETESEADDLLQELSSGKIYKFPYSFRGGLEADAGFLLTGEQGEVFFAVGDPTEMQFVGFAQATGTIAEDEAVDEDDRDLMDFGMI